LEHQSSHTLKRGVADATFASIEFVIECDALDNNFRYVESSWSPCGVHFLNCLWKPKPLHNTWKRNHCHYRVSSQVSSFSCQARWQRWCWKNGKDVCLAAK